ncbi:MAG: SpoIIE family protein phosphatase [Bacteroidales bacterium]|nr:SpoIIE family protein phosphatase [Candidatus Cacconaster merdequi]
MSRLSFKNVIVWIAAVGAFVSVFGFWAVIRYLKGEVTVWVQQEAQHSSAYVHNYVDGSLESTERLAFALAAEMFDDFSYLPDGTANVRYSPGRGRIVSEEEIFHTLDLFLASNPHIYGVGIGFREAPGHLPKYEYGFGCYSSNTSEGVKRYQMGGLWDYHYDEWYCEVLDGKPRWCHPFEEMSGKVVAGFSVPVLDSDSNVVAVLALGIDTEIFQKKCTEVTPIPGSDISLIDGSGRFIANSEPYLLLSDARKSPRHASLFEDKESDTIDFTEVSSITRNGTIFYFTPIERSGWTICAEFPDKAVLESLKDVIFKVSMISMVSQAFIILFIALLFFRALKIASGKASIERELSIASHLQMEMLHPRCPDRSKTGGCDFFAYLNSAADIGGDLYDYRLHDGKLYFCIGDVAGKGVPASLFMAGVLELFRNEIFHTDSPARIATHINLTLASSSDSDMFCTMFIGVLYPESGRLVYCNAGHNPPLLGGRFLDSWKVLPVGAMNGTVYRDMEVVMKKDDYLVMYTDGVTEAENSRGEFFGNERLAKALGEVGPSSEWNAERIVNHLLGGVKKFAGKASQSDDITIVAIGGGL